LKLDKYIKKIKNKKNAINWRRVVGVQPVAILLA